MRVEASSSIACVTDEAKSLADDYFFREAIAVHRLGRERQGKRKMPILQPQKSRHQNVLRIAVTAAIPFA